jgi:multidrug efflux pump
MFARFFVDRPVFAWVIALSILIAGLLALRVLPISAYPEVAPPALSISVNYPGASAQVVEDTVTAIIEQEMNGIDHLLYMDSSSEQGTATINLTFTSGTNLDIASVEAQNRVKRIEARLPDDVRRNGVVFNKSRRNYLLFVAVHSPDNSLNNIELGSFAAANVLDPLRRVPGVGEATMFGTEYSMRIWLKPEKMHALGISPADVSKAVKAQNVQLATGEIGQAPGGPDQQLNAVIVVRSRLSTPEQFGDIIVREKANGATVRVKDIARVELGAQDYNIYARFNGRPTANVGIKLTPEANALQTARAVHKRMEELSVNFPQGVAWKIPYDTSRFVEVSIHEVLKTLVEAVILVFLVMYLFLENLRATLIPTIVVPVALVGALVGIDLLGYSINVLTLFAMVLAIGIVVDDAIVVVESVERIMSEEGLHPREATYKAMGQIFNAIIGITLVLCAVFVPMAFFAGTVGAIYRQFAVTLVLTMLFSALMALTLTPALCATLLKHEPGQSTLPSTGFFGWFNRRFAATTRGYIGAVRSVTGKRGRYLLLYLGIAVIAGGMYMRLSSSFLPEEDQGYLLHMIQLPPGATQARTLEVVDAAEKFYANQPEVADTVGVVGFSFFGRGQNSALLFVMLKPWEARHGADHSVMAITQRANMEMSKLKTAVNFSLNVPPIPELGTVGGFDFRLQDRAGLGREKLIEARGQMLGMAAAVPNKLMGVRPEGMEAGPQLLLDVDRTKAQALGIDQADLNDALGSALGVSYINDFVRQGRILRVQMQAEAATRSSPEHVMQLPIKSANGKVVTLAEVATPRWIMGSPKLDRYNGVPSLKIAGGAAPGGSTGDAIAAMTDLATKLPSGFGYEWSGVSYEELTSSGQAALLFGLSVAVVFLALAALYESWSIPFAVMLIVPLGVFGAVLAVTLRGLPNDVYFKVGMITTIGLSAKNAILIIEFARELQERGMSLIDATLEACRLRFRPILMTSIAFIVGVFPLAISTGAGAQSRHAIGTGVMGGMVGATLLGVFLVPLFFVVVRRIFPGHPRHHGPGDHGADSAAHQENGHA